MRKMFGSLTTCGGFVLVALAFPLVILALGTPVVLASRLVLELVGLR